MGTVSSIHVNDQTGWPNSPWRLLQVTWDEPDLLQNVKRVNPWSVELVSSIHLSPYSQPKKKFRIFEPPNFHLQPLPLPPITATSHHHPTSIQGARHSNPQFGSNNNPQFNKLTQSSFPHEILTTNKLFALKETDENVSCLLTIGNNFKKKVDDENDEKDKRKRKKPSFVLFGQPILTEQQLADDNLANPSVSS
ncbi:hypothetical protein L1887_23694 [Cichorium endivia]|nr:hypothetical protein L1887_23694 [Cichorium endivia]